MTAPRDRCSALLLDLDGVLRRFDPARVAAAERRHGLPAGTLMSAAFAAERLRPVLTGRARHEGWMARNVRGARQAGLAALRYTGPQALRYAEAALAT